MTLNTPISISSLADEAFKKLANAIVRGELSPGERISEAQLARQFGISRGPLREALNRLEGLKLVCRKPNLGAYVMSLSERDFNELCLVREVLEGLACRLAAVAMTDSEIEELGQLLERHGTNKAGMEGKRHHHATVAEDFHSRIVTGARNQRLIRDLRDTLYYQLSIYRYTATIPPGRPIQAFKEHQQILEALRSRSPERAETAMRQHLANVRLNLTHKDDNEEGTRSRRKQAALRPVHDACCL